STVFRVASSYGSIKNSGSAGELMLLPGVSTAYTFIPHGEGVCTCLAQPIMMIGLLDIFALYRKRSTRKVYDRTVRRYLEYIYALPEGKRSEIDYNDLSLQHLQAD